MSDIAVRPPADLAAMDVPDLKKALATELQLSAASLLRAAGILAELERRGEDMSQFKAGIGRTISMIASGRLAAEAVVAFVGRPGVLQLMDGLPLDRQRELAAGAEVEVYDPDQKATVRGTVSALPHAAVRRVFADGRELDPAAQRLAMTARAKRKRAESDGREYRVTVDRERRVVRVGRMEVPVEEVLAAFALAAVGDRPPDADLRADAKRAGTSVAVAECHLTADEDERLRAACKAKKLDRGEAVRRAVVAMLLL